MKTTAISLGEGKKARALSVTTNKDGFVVGVGGKDGDAWDELDELVRAGWLVPAGTHKGEDVYRLAKRPTKPALNEAPVEPLGRPVLDAMADAEPAETQGA